jgi:hypothetical protein
MALTERHIIEVTEIPNPKKNIVYAGLYNVTFVHSRVVSNTFTMGNPTSESALTLCQSRLFPQSRTLALASVAKFIVPDWGNKVNFGKWLSFRPAKLHRLGGRYDNHMPESETMTLATELEFLKSLWGLGTEEE